MKYTRFGTIPRLTNTGDYQIAMPINHLPEWIEGESARGLILEPDFQRGHVWSRKQQADFIAYLLRGGQSGKDVYFNHPYWNTYKGGDEGAYAEYVCVDGLQRITACLKFINNELPVFGSLYREFTDHLPLDAALTIHVNDLQSRKDVLTWYLEMNWGGKPHTTSELNWIKRLRKEAE